jgi:transcriptional regulator NrdR family protein
MQCPSCGGKYSRTVKAHHDTLDTQLHHRVCKHCNHKWWTVEVSLPFNAVQLLNGEPTRTLLYQELKFTSRSSTSTVASNRWKHIKTGNLG